MKARKATGTALRFVLLGVAFIAGQMLATGIGGQVALSNSPIDPQAAVRGLVIARFSAALALGFVALTSKWSGWKLAAALSLVEFLVGTLLTQIEALLFLTGPNGIMTVQSVTVMARSGALYALLVGPLTVLIMGKMRKEPAHGAVSGGQDARKHVAASNEGFQLPKDGWFVRLGIIAVSYVITYFTFGMLVAVPLAGPAFAEYYKNLPVPAWLSLFQAARAMVWTAAALPLVAMSRGSRQRIALQVGLLFSVLMGFLLFVPNPFMPDSIRVAHLVELSTSNFVFGCLVAYVLTWKRVAVTHTAGQLAPRLAR